VRDAAPDVAVGSIDVVGLGTLLKSTPVPDHEKAGKRRNLEYGLLYAGTLVGRTSAVTAE
jgi:hypothetical protein